MKALFLVFHGLEAHGIHKKIVSQVNALRSCGIDTQICSLTIDAHGFHKRVTGNAVLDHFGKGVIAKIKKRVCYKNVIRYIDHNNIRIVYIRSAHNANPFLICLLKKLKKMGVKCLLEIPTYPYDQEYINVSYQEHIGFFFDKLFRRHLARQMDRIITFSDHKTIFGVPTINISNGVDFEQIKVKENTQKHANKVRLIGVAEIHFWHGFDRVLNGLADYYREPRDVKVFFDIVGDGIPEELDKLKRIIAANNLEGYVTMCGPKIDEGLDQLFEKADMGIASLGRHRSGITRIKPLKNREYAARGMAFVYSEIDDDFEGMPYVMKAPADDTPLNIEQVIQFFYANRLSPAEIRSTVIDKLSWNVQMRKVIETVNKI